VIELALIVLAHLKDHGVALLSNPANGTILLRQVGALVLIVRTRKNLLRLLKPDAALRVLPQPHALHRIEVEAPRSIRSIV